MHGHCDIAEFIRLVRDEPADRVRINDAAHLYALRLCDDNIALGEERAHIEAEIRARDRQLAHKELADAPLPHHAVDRADLTEDEARTVND